MKRYKHPFSDVILLDAENSCSIWYVLCGDSEDVNPLSKTSARLVTKHAVLVEVAELRNKMNALQYWADALSTDDFEEYYKEYVQE